MKLKLLSSIWILLFVSTSFAKSIHGGRVTVEAPTAVGLINFQEVKQEGQALCEIMNKTIADWSAWTQPVRACALISSTNDVESYKAQINRVSAGTLVLLKNNTETSSYDLEIINLKPEDESDPRSLRWSIKKGEQAQLMLKKLLLKYNDFDVKKMEIKKILLSEAPKDPGGASRMKSDDSVSFILDYKSYIEKSESNKKYMAAAVEIAAILGFSTVNYYLAPALNNPNNVDWDYNSKSSLRARLNGDAVRFDDNHFHTNEGHYYAGTVYYTVARNAGLNRWESLLVTFAASSFWEYVSEYREVVSINDQINTTYGGFILGETIFQVSKIFQRPGSGLTHRILREIFGSPQKLTQWVDRKIHPSSNSPLFNGVEANPDIWSKLDLSIGTLSSNKGAKSKVVAANAEVISIPMFEEPGQASELISDTVFSNLMIQKSIDGTDDLFKLFAKSTLAAYYFKNLRGETRDQMEGYNLFIGPSSALEIENEVQFDDKRSKGSDFRGIVHVLGPTLDATIYHNGWRIRCVIDVYADFAMIRSYGFESYRQSNDVSKVDTILRDKDYYHAFGMSQSLSLTVEKGPWTVGVAASQSALNKFESGARFKETQTDQVNPRDEVSVLRGWVVYQLSKNLKFELGAEARTRSGSVGGGPPIRDMTLEH
jgi:hypothetical protein